MKVLMATTNEGKVAIFKEEFDKLNIEILTLKDLNITTSPEENGKSVVENAIIKAKYYYALTKMPVFANDAGLVINKFSKEEQAGLFVRRFGGVELTDKQMIERYIEKLNKVGGKSKAHFNVGLAIITDSGALYSKSFKPKLLFINKPSGIIKKGVPLDSLVYDRKTKKYKSEMTIQERNKTEGNAFKKQAQFIKRVFLNKKIRSIK